ncbi:MAG: hypothetical protein L0312_20070 [Acidobacteria bacterium]|nr:hypothetical protein [Acidobacteriota bacterium]
MTKQRRSPIDACLIALNRTQDYAIEDEDKPFVHAIREVYLYDRNEHTYCCELTPSYWLLYVSTMVLFPEGTTEEVIERVEQRYIADSPPSDNCYVHVYEIDSIAEQHKKWWKHHGRTGVKYKDVERDEQLEALIEHFSANTPF